jgi:hypothetical protein
MNTSSDNKINQPKIIDAFSSGFNTVANKPYLILLPVIVDLFLWFGPAWRVDSYFKPLIQGVSGFTELEMPEYAAGLESYKTLWQDIISNFNLATSLHTLPIGVPSLMVAKPPFLNPLGQPLTFSLKSGFQVFGFWLLFLLIGFFLGSIYFQNISHQVIDPRENGTIKILLRAYVQIILMPILLLIVLLILSIPLMFIISLITMVSPMISQFILLIAGLILLWVLMPLIFTPHGIFLFKQNLISAMMTSISVVRVSMAQTAQFILLGFILIKGLDYLWQIPHVDNWLLIVGILGHAFISSAVITSSFHYFMDATKFTQTVMNKKMKSA